MASRNTQSVPHWDAQDQFQRLTVDMLKEVARLISTSPPARKEPLVQLLTAAVTDGTRLQDIYGKLDPKQQGAVQLAVEQPDGVLPLARYVSTHGGSPVWRTQKAATWLALLFPDCSQLPRDVHALLKQFVPPHPPAAIACTTELPATLDFPEFEWDPLPGGRYQKREIVVQEPLVVAETEAAALHDVSAILALIQAGKLPVSSTTGRAGAVGQQNVLSILLEGDFYTHAEPPDDPDLRPTDDRNGIAIRTVAWPLLVQAAGLAAPSGTRLALTDAGIKATGQTPEKILRICWDRWQKTTLLDEFSRVSAIKGQQVRQGKSPLTAAGPRRTAIRNTLALCPIGRWMKFDAFSRLLLASGYTFEVARHDWDLYFSERNYGTINSTGLQAWETVHERYMRAFLFEYAATLGVIDVAFVRPEFGSPDLSGFWGADDLPYLSRYDGLWFLRLTPLGAWLLNLTKTYTPAPPEVRAVLRVLANYEVVVTDPAVTAAERLTLERFTEAASAGVRRLTRAKALAATEEGMSVADMAAFLRDRNDGPLPQTVELFFSDLQARTSKLVDRGGWRLIECAEAVLAHELANDRRLRKHCLVAGERHVAIPEKEFEAARRVLRELGYVIGSSNSK